MNEGFATYYESLYGEHKHGRDSMLYELYHRARDITANVNDTTPIVRRNYDKPSEMFGYLSYPKAGWVLHMLRSQLGEDLYRKCIKTYLERYQYGNVVTENLRTVIEELSGRSYDQFFDQWLYHGRFPDLEVDYNWDEQSKQARIAVRQTQQVDQNVLLFSLPLTIRFYSRTGAVDRVAQVTKKQEDFAFGLSAAPDRVRVDPDYTLLAKLRFSVPKAMLYAQLADQKDVVGRLLVIEQLASRRDNESVTKLKDTLNQDTFYGVRIEAAKALRGIHTEEALTALLASRNQPDARVRREVVDSIGGFYGEKALEAGRDVLRTEKNPDIVSTAIRDLGGYTKPEVHAELIKYLSSDSYHNELAGAAISALRLQDDPADVSPLLETLRRRASDFTSHGFGQGLDVLAYLARNDEKKVEVREFLTEYINDKRRPIQFAAINGLGTLGDTKAIGALEKFASGAKAGPERSAAERAVASLRAGRKPVDDFKNLRQEVLDLQRDNREMRKELDEIKKKAESGSGATAATAASRTTSRPAQGGAAGAKPKAQSPKANP